MCSAQCPTPKMTSQTRPAAAQGPSPCLAGPGGSCPSKLTSTRRALGQCVKGGDLGAETCVEWKWDPGHSPMAPTPLSRPVRPVPRGRLSRVHLASHHRDKACWALDVCWVGSSEQAGSGTSILRPFLRLPQSASFKTHTETQQSPVSRAPDVRVPSSAITSATAHATRRYLTQYSG